MSSLVVVVGATGTQGQSVCKTLLESRKYKVRGLTRKVDGQSAKALAAEGVEIAFADVNDVASLERAFAGATAIFALTAFWPSILALGRHGAGEEEAQQHTNMAKAAAKVTTLQHYIISSLPPANRLSGGKFEVPHYDYKQLGYEWMERETPELAAKSTRLWIGWYTDNMAYSDAMKMTPASISGTYLLLEPSKPDAMVPVAGNARKNTGIMVEAILNHGPKAHGKIAILITEYLTMEQVVQVWSKVTGKRAAFIDMPDDICRFLWGPYGDEIMSQFRWSEEYGDWHSFFPEITLSHADLGVNGKLVGHEEALNDFKDLLL